MRKEMDELKNAMKEKTNKNLDRRVERTDSLFTSKVLECPLLLKFCLPQLELFIGLRDPLDYITTFKMTLSLQQTPDEILCKSFLTTLKDLQEYGLASSLDRPLTTSSNLATSSYVTSSVVNDRRG